MLEADVKIAPLKMSSLLKDNSSSENDSVKEYIFHRKLGNIQRAHKLGRLLAEDLPLALWVTPPANTKPESFNDQLMTLYSYVVARTLELSAPNQTLAHTAMGTFYDELERANPKFFDKLVDSGSFSLYLYLDRMNAQTPEAIGTVFANQCFTDDINACSELGRLSYIKFRDHCVKMLGEADFVSQ